MKAPRFSLRQLLLSMLLVNFGLAGIAGVIWYSDQNEPLSWTGMAIWLASGAIVRAGDFGTF